MPNPFAEHDEYPIPGQRQDAQWRAFKTFYRRAREEILNRDDCSEDTWRMWAPRALENLFREVFQMEPSLTQVWSNKDGSRQLSTNFRAPHVRHETLWVYHAECDKWRDNNIPPSTYIDSTDRASVPFPFS